MVARSEQAAVVTTPEQRRVVLVGGGGHAAVCLDVLRAAGHEILGYIANDPSELDLVHLGDDSTINELSTTECSIFVAVGDNKLRMRLIQNAALRGHRFARAVSPNAVVSASVTIGECSVIMPGVVINARTTIGVGVIVNTSASIDHDGRVGDFAHIAPGCHLAGSVSVGSGAFLGVGVSVIPGRSIGDWAIVGAGAAVVTDIAPSVTAVGVPARPLIATAD